jgi:hypothetical protein
MFCDIPLKIEKGEAEIVVDEQMKVKTKEEVRGGL